MIENEFSELHEDHCVYVKHLDEKFIIMTLYVDDILMASNNLRLLETTKSWLSSKFEMKDMGEASFVLGVKILRNRPKRLLGITQETYIKNILKRYNLSDCKPMDTPVMKGVLLSTDMGPKTPQEKERMRHISYSSAVGSLMYAMMCTRPDICYAVGLVSRFQSNPGLEHWKAVKRILRYLKGTASYVLCYGGSDTRLIGYTDADWGGDPDERKSTSGYAFLLSGGAVSWCSKKQSCIALSTMEAEYVAATTASQEAVWLRRFLKHLGVISNAKEPVTMYCDSMAALAYIKDPKYHGKTKHIQIRYHYVRDISSKGKIVLRHVSTSSMLADHLTKAINRESFQSQIKALGLKKGF